MAFASRLYQSAEDCAGGFVFIDGALGMPLYRQHEVIGRSSFHSFDDTVVGAAGSDAQAISDRAGGLVVGRVDGHDELGFLISR